MECSGRPASLQSPAMRGSETTHHAVFMMVITYLPTGDISAMTASSFFSLLQPTQDALGPLCSLRVFVDVKK